LNELRGNKEERSNHQIWRSFRETAIKVAGDCKGRELRGRVYMVLPIRNELVVMSQWAHCHWNVESTEAASAWPLIWQPSQPSRKPRRKVPLSCVEDFPIKWGLGKSGWSSRSSWVTCAHQDW
jgi:hypothetical protein